MSYTNNIFGGIVQDDSIPDEDAVEIRYALSGKNVRFFKNLTFLATHYVKTNGLNSVKENFLFQKIFDQQAEKTFNHSYLYKISLGPQNRGQVFVIDLSNFTSIEDFNLKTEAFESEVGRDKSPGTKPAGVSDKPELDLDLPAATDAPAGEKKEMTEEEELAALERELAEAEQK
jgi:hypothetical protein